ncbi:MAG: hypothetical protein ACJ735_12135 [Actinomycetes bacterium]
MALVLAAACCVAMVCVGFRYARNASRDEIGRWRRNTAVVGRLGGDDSGAVAPAAVWCRVVSTATIPKQREHRAETAARK